MVRVHFLGPTLGPSLFIFPSLQVASFESESALSTAISPMAGISEKRVKVIVGTSRKSRKIGQHRITKTTQNQLCPNQRSQMTKMRHQNVPVHRQRVLRAGVPAMNCFEGTSSSKTRPRNHRKGLQTGLRPARGICHLCHET